MTTIATDGKTVAADTNVIYGSLRSVGTATKIIRVGSEIVGCAGGAADCEAYLKWCLLGRRKASAPTITDSFHALHVSKKAIYLVSNGALAKTQIDAPMAIGSGDDFALGAMWAGASPKRAVEVVKKHTTCADGDITELKV